MPDPLDEALSADPDVVDEQDPELLEAMQRWRDLNAAPLPTIEPRNDR